MTRQICCFLMLFSFLGLASLQAGEMTELQKRKAFAKAYMEGAKASQRVAALNLLNGCEENASFLCLAQVAKTDGEPAVRLAAYNMVSGWDDPMGRMESVLLPIFLNESDRGTKVAMSKAFPRLKTKSAALDAMVKFLGKFQYPTYDGRDRDRDRRNNNNNNNNNGSGGTLVNTRSLSAKAVAKLRREFNDVLGVINALSGQSFPPGDATRSKVRKWWTMHQVEFVKKDALMLKKLEAEARAAADKARAERAGKS